MIVIYTVLPFNLSNSALLAFLFSVNDAFPSVNQNANNSKNVFDSIELHNDDKGVCDDNANAGENCNFNSYLKPYSDAGHTYKAVLIRFVFMVKIDPLSTPILLS